MSFIFEDADEPLGAPDAGPLFNRPGTAPPVLEEDVVRLRHANLGVYPTRPTNERFQRAPQATARGPDGTPATPPQPVSEANFKAIMEATANWIKTGDMRPLLAAQLVATTTPAAQAPFAPNTGAGVTPVTQAQREAEALRLAALDAEAIKKLKKGPSQRVLDLQYFLTYLYQKIGNITYKPPLDVSYTNDEILTNDDYYGSVIAAYQKFKLYARGEDLPTIEEICRDPDSVLFDALVDLAAAFCRESRIASRDMDKPRYGVGIRANQAHLDMRGAIMFARGCVNIYLGRTKESELAYLRPKVF